RHGRAAGRGGRGRGRERAYNEEEEEEQRPRYSSRDKGPNTNLILGSLGLLVVAAIVAFIALSGEKKQEKAETDTVQPAVPIIAPPPPPEPAPETEKPKEPEKPKDVEDARPELRKGTFASVPIPEGKTRYRWSAARPRAFPYPDSVTAEEKNEIETQVNALVELGGRDARDAEKYFLKLDGYPKPGNEFKAVGRLISEFKNILDKYPKIDDTECMSRLMVVDRCLRKIDGMQERDFRDIEPINYQSLPKEAMNVIKRWVWWYDLEKWHLRREPWDPREDMLDSGEGDPDGGGG
ncbi:MAG: hypothetical protein ACC662_02755, partial [Planctomycetota bacterium]